MTWAQWQVSRRIAHWPGEDREIRGADADPLEVTTLAEMFQQDTRLQTQPRS